MYVHIISKLLDIGQMRMGEISSNSVGKKKFKQRKYLAVNSQYH